MAKLEVVKIGHPVLREKAQEVSPEKLREASFQKFLKAMAETMRRYEGVGLAANQVGQGIQALVLECRSNPRYPKRGEFSLEIWINPKILEYSEKQAEDWEGCLSIPGYRGRVPRALSVTYEGLDPEGKRVRKTVQGFQARVIQHEVDHLNGLFYIDRMPNLQSWVHLDEFNALMDLQVRDRGQ